MNFSQWATGARQTIEATLEAALAQRQPRDLGRGDQVLHEAMCYGVLGGGKRIRALLSLAAGEVVGAPAPWCAQVGAAVECIHAFSLVHDDMPCMDDDALRRGQPTVHVKYGQAQALLVGDALQTLGFELLAELPAPAEQVVRLVRVMARATGLQGMAGGQAVDIAAVGQSMSQDRLEAMHAMKTGALIAAAVEMGALCGSPSEQDLSALRHFSEKVGLGFQVADDVLDVSADAQTLGKTPGKDAAANKPNFVALLGLEGARGYARGLHQEAIEALAPFGGRADRLRELAHALIERTH
ncbi:MAG: polyprenyl synthetase family protein [Burkholderiaceae bacterium]|nr:polyprenyl synthetase family protein [Burkholderiaceae bacterium]